MKSRIKPVYLTFFSIKKKEKEMLFSFKSRVCEKHMKAESQCKHAAQIVVSIYYFIQMKVAEYECKLPVCHQVKLECQGCRTFFFSDWSRRGG